MKLTGENLSTRGETCPSAILSTTNPTWTDPGLNPGLRGETPATNRLSHGTAMYPYIRRINIQRFSSYFTENTLRPYYKDQLVDVSGNVCCLL
jgi:hypothetical protein